MEVWAFEAEGGLRFVHSIHGKHDIDIALAQVEASALGRLFFRVHRSWLANLRHVRVLEYVSGDAWLVLNTHLGNQGGVRIPVSQERARAVRETLLGNAIGLRRRERSLDQSGWRHLSARPATDARS
jgi:DNA-binding LytR/AlgR family response regulator